MYWESSAATAKLVSLHRVNLCVIHHGTMWAFRHLLRTLPGSYFCWVFKDAKCVCVSAAPPHRHTTACSPCSIGFPSNIFGKTRIYMNQCKTYIHQLRIMLQWLWITNSGTRILFALLTVYLLQRQRVNETWGVVFVHIKGKYLNGKYFSK